MRLKISLYGFILIFLISCGDIDRNDEIKRLGNFQNRPRGFQAVNMPGGQVALFIPNTGEYDKIRQVAYFIGDKGDFSKKLRVMLYNVDSVSGKPLDKLLPDTIVVSAKRGNEWLNVDVSSYDIIFPEKGLFVAMEWLPGEDFNVASESECQYIAYNRIRNTNQTWYCALNMNWYQLPGCNYNTMIYIDVKIKSSQSAN